MKYDMLLPDLDGKKTQKTIEAVFEKYQFCKFTVFEEVEASITASYDLREGSSGGTVTDQTSRIAVYNVDTPIQRRLYMEKIQKAVNRLPRREKQAMEAKYMNDDAHVTDFEVYERVLGVSIKLYAKIRRDAFYKLAFMFNDMGIVNIDDLIKE